MMIDRGVYITDKMALDYVGAKITNIRRGKNGREQFIYAHIEDANGVVLVQAELDYCVARMKEISQHPLYKA